MPTISRVRRKRGPALTWAPTEDSYYELAQMLRSEGRLPLYLTQAAILEFEAHLRESSLPLPFGLLAGDLCLCPDTKLEYLLIDTVARARIELGGDDPYAQLAEELQSLASEQTKQRKLSIGWYLGGLADDLTLDAEVTALHGQLFPERWQVALVRGAHSGAERGAFLRYEGIWSRWYSIPFSELLSERAGHKKGEVRTAIRWENYRSDGPARALDEFEVSVRRANAAPRPSWGARFFGASLEPLRRAGRSTPRRVPERTEATSAPARGELSSAPPAQTMAPPAAPRPSVMVPPTRTEPREITPPPRRAPDPPRVEPVERKVAAHVDQTVAAPMTPKPAAPVAQSVAAPVAPEYTPPVEPRAAESVAPVRAAPPEELATTAPQLRVAPTPELKVASTAQLSVAPSVEVELAPPAEVMPPASPDATAAVLSEEQQVFIDGSLMRAPLAYDFAEQPGMLPGPNRVRISSLVVGALLLLILVLLYLIAS
jgi:hypothetical protein